MAGHLSEYTISKKEKGRFLNQLIPMVFSVFPSKTKAKKAIASGEVLVNGKRVGESYRVNYGDVITTTNKIVSTTPSGNRAVLKMTIEVVFEDEYIAVVNKPGGLATNGPKQKTLENALPYNLKVSKKDDVLPRPLPVHRLDEPTCGLVVVAKTAKAQVIMGRMFQEKNVHKCYTAVVIGGMKPEEGQYSNLVKGQKAKTTFKVKESCSSKMYGRLSYVELFPITGRTHQLRIHCAENGHPIIGDKMYSNEYEVLTGKGLMLCSNRIEFDHPISGELLTLEIAVPNKFKKFMEREAFSRN